ncbi:MAG: ABC transporter substrate-binding protein, partial [Gemmatimonadota bacterium]|nr:ABC transporter substrate-binding protein [Gemmatimonadota bacterium]
MNLKIWMICCIGVWAIPVQAQLSLQYAQGFSVDYFDSYRVVTVSGNGIQKKFQYVLVQRGHESPDGYEGVPRIEIPVRTVIATSTTHLPHLEKLGEVHSLVGIDNIKYVSSEAVNRRFAAGELVEVGRDRSIDLEKVLVLQPDLVMTDSQAQDNSLLALQEAGVPVVVNAAYAEPSLLGRVEWIKFVGAFFHKEEQASAQFDSIVVRYEVHRALTQSLPVDKRPAVFVGSLWRGTWFMSGGKTYAAQLLRDAGANYLWGDDDSQQGLALDFETVYEKAHDADCWITMRNEWRSRDGVVAEDERYRKFTAFENGNVFNANAR